MQSSHSCWEVSGTLTDVLALPVDGVLMESSTYRKQSSQHLNTQTIPRQRFLENTFGSLAMPARKFRRQTHQGERLLVRWTTLPHARRC
jgi:hypothetical protein